MWGQALDARHFTGVLFAPYSDRPELGLTLPTLPYDCRGGAG